MPKWNEQQRRAVEIRERNILVSASAGSGKTTVLVGRLMDLVLKDGISVDQILAMTFTEAAANEMKKRLSAALQDAARESEDEAVKARLNRQLTLMQSAQISTIHSFCLSILQSYYYIIGCTARQIATIADNAQTQRFQQQAMANTLRLHQGEALNALRARFSARPGDDAPLCGAIRSLAALASSKPDPDAWLQSCALPYHGTLPQEMRDSFFAFLQLQQRQIVNAMETLCALLHEEFPHKEKAIEKAEQKRRLCAQAWDVLRLQDYAGYRRAFMTCCRNPLPNSPDKDNALFLRCREEIKDSEDRLAAVLFDPDTLQSDMQASAGSVDTLTACTRTYLQEYRRLKQEAEVIDFDDMEHFALAILQAQNGAVAARMRERFAIIMVDEFQDTNDIQDTIISLIARENNVFRVGDIKQSIYGFRHARPQIMQSRIDHAGALDEVIYLSNNYRSSRTLVEFNNVFYQKLMNLPEFSSSYREQDCVAIGGPWQEKVKEPVRFHALLADELKKDPVFQGMSTQQIKALWIASRIRAMHEEGRYDWKDFVVLVRSNRRKDDLRAAFDRLALPYFIEIKHGFYQSNAVQIVLSALNVLHQPHDDLAFVSLMLSPLFDADEDMLAQARLEKERNASYYAHFRAHPFPGFAQLETLMHKRDLPIHALLNEVYALNDYYACRTTLQEKTNLDLLYQQAVKFEETHSNDLHAFLSYIDSIKDAQSGEANPISSEDDVIRVMSIHQSKGLQFPVVFLWSTDRQAALDFREPFLFDADMGIGARHMDERRVQRPTLARIAIQHKKDREELEEEMRILYVATTRAQDEMIVVDCIKDPEQYRTPLDGVTVFSRCGYTGWLLHAFSDTASSLFSLQIIQDPFDITPQRQAHQPEAKRMVYRRSASAIERISASSRKGVSELPIFDPSRIERQGARRGTLMHEVIAELHPPFSTAEIQAAFSRRNAQAQPWDIRQLQALGNDTAYLRFCAMPKVCHELPYQARIGDQIFYGYIDFLAMDDHMIIIVDYKTDALEEDSQFVTLYQEQLRTYAMALSQIWPDHEIRTYLYAFHLNRMIPA